MTLLNRILIALGLKKKPAPPIKERAVAVVLSDNVTGAAVTLHAAGVTHAGITNADGYVCFGPIIDGPLNVEVAVVSYGYHPYRETIDIPSGNFDIKIAMVKVVVEPPKPARPTGEDVLHVLANFCNLRDRYGRVIFGPTITGLPLAERMDWYARQRDAGSTHCVLTPGSPDATDYEGSVPMPKLLANPMEFRKFVLEALETPSASGKGFCPIIIIDEGHRDPRARIDAYWSNLIDAIRDLLDHCIIVPGWELIKESQWRSSDYSYALKALHSFGVIHLWAHLSLSRASGASNPLEADDPWQGSEQGFWKEHGGEYLEGLLYQADPLRDGDNPNCDPTDDNCWLNRLEDVIPRIGNGMNGWRVVRLCLFENIAYHYYRGRASNTLVRDMATAGKKMADRYGVKMGFGNGLPW